MSVQGLRTATGIINKTMKINNSERILNIGKLDNKIFLLYFYDSNSREYRVVEFPYENNELQNLFFNIIEFANKLAIDFKCDVCVNMDSFIGYDCELGFERYYKCSHKSSNAIIEWVHNNARCYKTIRFIWNRNRTEVNTDKQVIYK